MNMLTWILRLTLMCGGGEYLTTCVGFVEIFLKMVTYMYVYTYRQMGVCFQAALLQRQHEPLLELPFHINRGII